MQSNPVVTGTRKGGVSWSLEAPRIQSLLLRQLEGKVVQTSSALLTFFQVFVLTQGAAGEGVLQRDEVKWCKCFI